MSISDRSKFNPNPCNEEQVQQNWRVLHRLVTRLNALLEPTEADDGKIPVYINSLHRWHLQDPCVATIGCGGSGGECATPGSWASGTTPFTKTLTLGGVIVPTGNPDAEQILDDSPYTLTCNGGDQYVYLDPDFPGGVLAVTLDILETSASVNISIGALTGSAVWTLSGLTAPFDYDADLNDTYTLTGNSSSQFDATDLTAAITA